MYADSQRSTQRRRRALLATVLAVFAVVAIPGVASAQDPTDAQYDSTLTQISVGSAPPSGGPPSSSGSSLPFTGLDLAAMAAVAAGLGIAGFAMRRRQTASEAVRG